MRTLSRRHTLGPCGLPDSSEPPPPRASPRRGAAAGDRIRVLCRFRPARPPADGAGGAGAAPAPTPAVDGPGFSLSVERAQVVARSHAGERAFTFDGVIDPAASQETVFDLVRADVLAVLEGFNCTCLAYGQTSGGKTYTMEGEGSGAADPRSGIVPRAADLLFEAMDPRLSYTVHASLSEIYNERVRDLLRPEADNLKVQESPREGVSVQGITRVRVRSGADLLRAVRRGRLNRTTAATLMNAQSSRSHSLLHVHVEARDEGSRRLRRGTLLFVDLAGSEKVSKTGAVGRRLKEAQSINRSLTTLGMVISALSRGYRHVPYRDSKLTRILSDSLGGNSKTTLLICAAPEPRHAPETLSALRFGESAKLVANASVRNEEIPAEELTRRLRRAHEEIARLRAAAQRGGDAGGGGGPGQGVGERGMGVGGPGWALGGSGSPVAPPPRPVQQQVSMASRIWISVMGPIWGLGASGAAWTRRTGWGCAGAGRPGEWVPRTRPSRTSCAATAPPWRASSSSSRPSAARGTAPFASGRTWRASSRGRPSRTSG